MKGHIVIDPELCKGCSYCVDACPKKILLLSGQFNGAGYYSAAVREPSQCTGCAVCAAMCPEIAITVYQET